MIDSNATVDSAFAALARTDLDGYEVFSSASKGLTIEVKDGALDVFVASENVGLSARALKDQRLGFAFCTGMWPGNVSKLIDRVYQGVSSSDPDPFSGFPLPSDETPPEVEQYDGELERIPINRKIEKAIQLERSARSYDPRIKKVRKASYVETTGNLTVCNHKGLRLTYKKTFVSGSIYVVAEDGHQAEMGWDYGFSPFFNQLDMDAIGTVAAKKAVNGLGARPVQSAKVPAILPPWVASDVLEILSESFLADNVQKGKSMLVGRKGESVFSPHVTIVDDGLYYGGMATSPFDDEGTVHSRNVLVSKGIIQKFLYDQHTANKENRPSTGNAGRQGIKTPPTVQTTNFFIEKGAADRETLLSPVGQGLMVTDIMGIHTADPISGDFSVGATGVWIEKGETTFPVKGIAVSGNLMQLFRDVEAVGNDLTFYGPFGSPTLRVSNLNIAGAPT
jgi:PmbA protein